MFRAIFVHLQERKTEIFTAYGIVSCCGRLGFGERLRGTICTVAGKILDWFLQLAIDPSYIPLEETSPTTSFVPYN